MISPDTFQKTLRYFLAPVVDYLDNDDDVSEIMINGSEIYIEKEGQLLKRPGFEDVDQLRAAVTNLAQSVGISIRPEEPRFDATIPFTLPNGETGQHRVHVVLPPLCRNGISVTIRKHSGAPLTLDHLVANGTLTREATDYLGRAVRQHRNIIVAGGTSTGKTTLLNVLSELIPEGERIVVIEDTTELKLRQDHVVSLQSRPPDHKGRGEVTIRDLLHSTLRMRPDRIVIGECRGGEALDLLQALNTGHGGSMSTVHANTPLEALQRLETLALFGFGGVPYPMEFLRAQVSTAIHVLVQLERLGGKRVVRTIAANLRGDNPSQYNLVDLFEYDLNTERLQPTEGLGAIDERLR